MISTAVRIKIYNYPKILLLCLVLLVVSKPAWAQETCLLIPASLPERVAQATVIVEGKVVAQKAFWDQQHQNIYTVNQVEIYELFKGEPSTNKNIQIITEGGRVNDDLQTYSNTLSLQLNQQGIFFLEPSVFPTLNQHQSTGPAYAVYASSQGFIQYDLPFDEAHDPFQKYEGITSTLYRALRALPQVQARIIRANPELQKAQPRKTSLNNPKARTQAIPTIADFTPDSLSAGTGAILTITGSNFGQSRGQGLVEFSNANDGGSSLVRALSSDYISWSDNQIKVKVPAYAAGVAASGQVRVTNNDLASVNSVKSLFVKYAVTGVLKDDVPYTPYHVNKDGNGGYIFRANASVNAEAAGSFTRALQTWTCQTAMNWQLDAQPTTLTVNAEDGINLFQFTTGSALPANVLGRTTSRYKGCGTNQYYRFWVDEIDFEFNNNISWNFGSGTPARNQYDFETVALHELGHAHQISHINYTRAVMHYSISRSQVTRQLNSISDIDAGNFVVSRSFRSNICGPTRLEPLIAENCVLPVPLLSFTATAQPTGDALLTWNTASATDLSYFVLERSANGSNWTTLTKLPPAATPTYNVTDPQPFIGFTYYRLRQVFNNQSFAYSPVRRVGTENTAQAGITLFPNPLQNNELHLEFRAPINGTVSIKVYDTAGRCLGLITRLVSQGNNPFYFDAAGLTKGLYIVQATINSATYVTKFVKI